MEKRLKLKVFLRSFLIQTGWNFERFQNMGFYFSIYPVLFKIWKTPSGLETPSLKQAFLRHISIFNTQPYMSGFVIGNVWKMEEKMSTADGTDRDKYEKEILNIKQALASSFASIGDRVFWGRLKPITVQIAILIWIASGYYGWLVFDSTGHGFSMFWIMFGPLCGTILYSLFAIHVRWKGLDRGYSCGGSSTCGLDAFDWPGIIRILSVIGFVVSLVILLFAFALLVILNYDKGFSWDMAAKLGSIFGVILLHYFMKRFGYSSLQTIFAMLIITAMFFGIF
jgi:PTS system mannose-specific IID component